MTDFEGQVLQQLSVLKMQMEQLLGNGQPGRMRELELRVESHERGMQRLKGLAGAFGGLLTFLQLPLRTGALAATRRARRRSIPAAVLETPRCHRHRWCARPGRPRRARPTRPA